MDCVGFLSNVPNFPQIALSFLRSAFRSIDTVEVYGSTPVAAILVSGAPGPLRIRWAAFIPDIVISRTENSYRTYVGRKH